MKFPHDLESFLEGPLIRKLPRPKRRKLIQIKLDLIKEIDKELSQEHGSKQVDKWITNLIKNLAKF